MSDEIKILNEKIDMLMSLLGISHNVKSVTIGGWLIDWKNTYKRKTQNPKTFADTERMITNHLSPLLDKDINQITVLELQNFIDSIENGRTRKAVYGMLKDAFNRAYMVGITHRNIFVNVELTRYQEHERRALTLSEQKKFLKAIVGHNYEIHFLLYLTTGIRKAEICNLEFNYSKKIIYVHGTKTKMSERIVPMHDSIIEKIKYYLNSGRLLATNNANISRQFKDIIDNLKIKDVTLHSLRHTFATRCVENGTDMKVLQKWLGHSTYEQTANRYTHIQDEYLSAQSKYHDKTFQDIEKTQDVVLKAKKDKEIKKKTQHIVDKQKNKRKIKPKQPRKAYNTITKTIIIE